MRHTLQVAKVTAIPDVSHIWIIRLFTQSFTLKLILFDPHHPDWTSDMKVENYVQIFMPLWIQ